MRLCQDYIYALVDDIILYDNFKCFEVTTLEVIEYHTHLLAYEVENIESSTTSLCLYNQFYCHGVLQKRGKLFIIEKDGRN